MRGAAGLKPVTPEARDLFRRPLLPLELKAFDAVVFDPPRQGAEAQAQQLAASKVPLVVGVSCDPVTFARDAALLVAGGYRLDERDADRPVPVLGACGTGGGVPEVGCSACSLPASSSRRRKADRG